MNKINVYLVEDYLLARINYRHQLANYDDIKLMGDFESAIDCIKMMENKQADVVVLDLKIKDISGIEAIKIIKEKYPKTKIIVLTSYKQEEEVLASLSLGANAYVLKDTSIDKLVDIIRATNIGAHFFDPDISDIALKMIPKPNSYDLNNLYTDVNEFRSLTKREHEVLKLIIDGKSNTQIANLISISAHTAKAHVCSILTKLNVTDRVQAAVKAVRTHLF